MRLHAYVLSVTPPALIDGTVHSREEWKQLGVYFLNENDCLKQLISHASGMQVAVRRNLN